MLRPLIAALVLPIVLTAQHVVVEPSPEHPSHWQVDGKPQWLLGGTDDDNLFQWNDADLRAHLDLLASVGGNYVRNTMSDRTDRGGEVYAYFQREDGKYDLERWNPEYWRRFSRFLEWTAERQIVVQIEVWDRFDVSREHWLKHPLNPKNNVNYDSEASGLAHEYPKHPGANEQPFFFTTPDQRDSRLLLQYQRSFVDKMLSYSLRHRHVLYCMDNETKAEEAWGQYWAKYIRRRANRLGVKVYLTEMWDDWDIRAPRHRQTIDHPELYDFVDLSQNNHNSGQEHWENAVWARKFLDDNPRPLNTVKTYGADKNKFGHTDQDGVERFFRHLLAGYASARFHRPPSGLGLNEQAQAAIQAARKLESLVAPWELRGRGAGQGDREGNPVYMSTAGSAGIVAYLPRGGSALVMAPKARPRLRWINGSTGEWGPVVGGATGNMESYKAPDDGHWLLVAAEPGE